MAPTGCYRTLAARASRPLAVAAAAAVFAGPAAGFFAYEPYGLSYYNVLTGGLPGASAEGLQVTPWGESIDDSLFEYVNQKAPQGARIAAFPMERLYVQNMRFFGLLRGDIKDVTAEGDWDYLFVANRQDSLASRPDIEALTRNAAVTKYVRGVPAAWLVEKKR